MSVASATQHAKLMRHIIPTLSSADSLVLPNSTTFLKRKLLNIKCVLWFLYIFCHLLSEKLLILRRTEWDIINVPSNSRKVSIILILLPCGLTDGRTDGKTEKTKSIVAFRNFLNASKHFIFIGLVRVCFITRQNCLMWFPLSLPYILWISA